jgi:hypothetical protein
MDDNGKSTQLCTPSNNSLSKQGEAIEKAKLKIAEFKRSIKIFE